MKIAKARGPLATRVVGAFVNAGMTVLVFTSMDQSEAGLVFSVIALCWILGVGARFGTSFNIKKFISQQSQKSEKISIWFLAQTYLASLILGGLLVMLGFFLFSEYFNSFGSQVFLFLLLSMFIMRMICNDLLISVGKNSVAVFFETIFWQFIIVIALILDLITNFSDFKEWLGFSLAISIFLLIIYSLQFITVEKNSKNLQQILRPNFFKNFLHNFLVRLRENGFVVVASYFGGFEFAGLIGFYLRVCRVISLPAGPIYNVAFRDFVSFLSDRAAWSAFSYCLKCMRLSFFVALIVCVIVVGFLIFGSDRFVFRGNFSVAMPIILGFLIFVSFQTAILFSRIFFGPDRVLVIDGLVIVVGIGISITSSVLGYPELFGFGFLVANLGGMIIYSSSRRRLKHYGQ